MKLRHETNNREHMNTKKNVYCICHSWMFVCYFTYCKNNGHNHSPTWKVLHNFKNRNISCSRATPDTSRRRRAAFFSGCLILSAVRARECALRCSFSSRLESHVREPMISLHCFWGAGPPRWKRHCFLLNQYFPEHRVRSSVFDLNSGREMGVGGTV